MVQNFYGPEPETGHMAGGLSQLLTGDGTGNFKPVSPEESGLVVFEDTKSLTRKDLDGDGWKDLIIGVNNGNIKVFKNHNSGTNKNAIISLAGKIGNSSAIGARVTAQYNDGSSRVRELQAGSGYLLKIHQPSNLLTPQKTHSNPFQLSGQMAVTQTTKSLIRKNLLHLKLSSLNKNNAQGHKKSFSEISSSFDQPDL